MRINSNNLFRLLWSVMIVALSTFVVSCQPEDEPLPQDSIPTTSAGPAHALVLCEGPMGNNASLSMIDLHHGELQNDWFEACNGRDLGNVAQDMVLYGSRVYVSVWGSGSLEVIDTATGVATHVDLANRGPRYIAAYGGKLFITCYSPRSVIRVDTATLQVEATCLLGDYNPEGIAALDGKLYVASDNIADQSGTYSYDDKLYVVDIASFAVESTITVGRNPQKVLVVDSTHLVVNYWGEWNLETYATEGEGSAVVDVVSNEVWPIGQLLSNMTVHDGLAYGYASAYNADGSTTASYYVVDCTRLQVMPLLPACTIDDPYCIAVNPVTDHIYIGTHANYSANGDVYSFSPDGKQQWSLEVGMLPSKVVFF